jgi:hypothetical protein
MADRASSGPVKPPVIDLTARTAARPEPDKPAANDAAPTPRKPDATPRPEAAARAADGTTWPLLTGVGIGGAVVGTVLTYLLANVLPLPSHVTLPPDLRPVVDAQSQQISALQRNLTDITGQSTKTQVSLDATIAQLDTGLSDVGKQIADLKSAIPPATPTVDLAPLTTQLTTLKAQVDALAAGAPGSDAGAIAQSLADLQTGVGTLTTRLNGIDTSLGMIRSDLDTARKSLSDHINAASPSEIGPALKLPLILSSLDTAFTGGKPFQDELAALAKVMPGVTVPAALTAAATTGLSRPDTLMQKFEAVLPQVLAAREINSGNWTENAVDWAKSLLALRPAEEEDGTTPEALASRIEGAMSRRDYVTVQALLAQLPPAMRQAAAPVVPDIAAHAAADQLLVDLRARALTAAEVPAGTAGTT